MAGNTRKHYLRLILICVACSGPSTSFRINVKHLSDRSNLSTSPQSNVMRPPVDPVDPVDPVTLQGTLPSERSELNMQIFNRNGSSVLESSLGLGTMQDCLPEDDLRYEMMPTSWRDFLDWRSGIGKCRGKGSFATVYIGKTSPSRTRGPNPGDIVLRRISKRTQQNPQSGMNLAACVNEARSQMRMKQSSLVQCYGYHTKSPGEDFWMLVEPMYGGELSPSGNPRNNLNLPWIEPRISVGANFMHAIGLADDPQIEIDEMLEKHVEHKSKVMAPLAMDVILGLEALETNEYVHCDIKKENILISLPKCAGNPRCHAKLADIGSGCKGAAACQRHGTYSPISLPPEMIEITNQGSRSIAKELIGRKPRTTKEDIWAAGLVLYNLWALQYPGPRGRGINLGPDGRPGTLQQVWQNIKRLTPEAIRAGLAKSHPPLAFEQGLLHLLALNPAQRDLQMAKGAFADFYRQKLGTEPPTVQPAAPVPAHVQRITDCWNMAKQCEYPATCADVPVGEPAQCACPAGYHFWEPDLPDKYRCEQDGSLLSNFESDKQGPRKWMNNLTGLATGLAASALKSLGGDNDAEQPEQAPRRAEGQGPPPRARPSEMGAPPPNAGPQQSQVARDAPPPNAGPRQSQVARDAPPPNTRRPQPEGAFGAAGSQTPQMDRSQTQMSQLGGQSRAPGAFGAADSQKPPMGRSPTQMSQLGGQSWAAPQAPQPQRQTISVQVPNGAQPGQMLLLGQPGAQVQVQIPQGVYPGMTFQAVVS